MAYGNWGAFVYRDGVRVPNREDATPYREDSEQAGYLQALGVTARSGRLVFDSTLKPHHAVLGQGRVRLCGYKVGPVLFVDGIKQSLEGAVTETASDEFCSYPVYWKGIVEDHIFSAEFDDDQNRLSLSLLEPDGTRWTATCGFEYGAGFEW